MARNKKARGNATMRGKARKAKPHVKAKRTSRVAKKQAKRAPRTVIGGAPDEANDAVAGSTVERVAAPPDTDSGLEPSEEKEILNALDADYNEGDEEGDRDVEDDET